MQARPHMQFPSNSIARPSFPASLTVFTVSSSLQSECSTPLQVTRVHSSLTFVKVPVVGAFDLVLLQILSLGIDFSGGVKFREGCGEMEPRSTEVPETIPIDTVRLRALAVLKRLGRDWCTPVTKVTKMEVGVSAPVLWEKISPRGVGRVGRTRLMTKSAASCKSHDMRATGITVLILILSMSLSVDASGRYKGVSKRVRKDRVSYYCEATFLGTSPREKIWLGGYPIEELAAVACDVVFYYTNRPSAEFNLPYSEYLIRRDCKARSAYENLHNWNDRREFIKTEANRLIGSRSSRDPARNLRWEDVAVPSLDSVRQRAGEIARTIVEHFLNQAERLQEFMAWFMAEEQLRPMEYSQTQHRDAHTSLNLDIDEVLHLGGDEILAEHHVASLVESLAWRRGGVWVSLMIAGRLAMLFQMFNNHTKSNAGDVEDASISPNDAKLTNRKKRQSERTKIRTKRQKVEHPSIQLVSDRVQALLTAITFDVRNKAWQCTGYDLLSRTWRALAPFPCLPGPDLRLYQDRFKKYFVSGHGGLMCANVSNPPNEGEVVVFNPLTGKTRALPPLLHPRNPVLLHMLVDSATESYKVIVAGSSSLTDEHLSKKMEVFDSQTSKWEETCDLPGPAFGLNEYQTGVTLNGILYFISFLEDGCRKGVVAFDVENGEWLPSMTCPLPCPLSSGIVQLVENDGEVYLFYEHQQRYERCIDVLEILETNAGAVTCQWRNVVRVENCGTRGFQSYPQYTCVGFGEGKLCIFNTRKGDGIVYDTGSGKVSDVLEPRSDRGSVEFCSLNSASFTLELSSEIDPTPPRVDDMHKGDGVVCDMGSRMVSNVLEPRLDRGEFFSLDPDSFLIQMSSEIGPTPLSVDDIQFGGTLLLHPFLQ